MNYETLRVDIDNRTATITLNRPNKRNCMSPQLHREMTDLLEKLRYDDNVSVLVFTGAGEAFCAGMDLKEFFFETKDSPARFDETFRTACEWRGRTLRYYPKTTIAMINGFCFGGAFSIVEGCDLAVAANNATFGLSEVNFKLFPGGTVSKSLANLLRPREALFYALTGRPFDGTEAARIGLINYAVPASELRTFTMDIAQEIAQKDLTALRATKDGYRYALEMSWDASINYTLAKQVELKSLQASMESGDWVEAGINDFLKGEYKPGLETHGQSAQRRS
ncbi:Hydroxycinnamoyl-CoA hydratase-lyase [Paraburkholderia kururiensis]|uniref:p-hydroxycinnamoyl CoA hydratase/lyase n=1 Tax=Paraburkholderia kururiensis TaxID=984307 RepID=UPI0039A5D545